MPIPVGLHPGSGGIHNIEKQYGIWGGIDGDVFSKMLQNINSMTIRLIVIQDSIPAILDKCKS